MFVCLIHATTCGALLLFAKFERCILIIMSKSNESYTVSAYLQLYSMDRTQGLMLRISKAIKADIGKTTLRAAGEIFWGRRSI